MIVVSNASPLITLARIGHLALLSRLYSQIRISAEVYNEVVIAGSGLPGAAAVAQSDWIEVTALRDATSLARAQRETTLGAGELSTVFLAKEIKAGLVLLDEWKARRLRRCAWTGRDGMRRHSGESVPRCTQAA